LVLGPLPGRRPFGDHSKTERGVLHGQDSLRLLFGSRWGYRPRTAARQPSRCCVPIPNGQKKLPTPEGDRLHGRASARVRLSARARQCALHSRRPVTTLVVQVRTKEGSPTGLRGVSFARRRLVISAAVFLPGLPHPPERIAGRAPNSGWPSTGRASAPNHGRPDTLHRRQHHGRIGWEVMQQLSVAEHRAVMQILALVGTSLALARLGYERAAGKHRRQRGGVAYDLEGIERPGCSLPAEVGLWPCLRRLGPSKSRSTTRQATPLPPKLRRARG